MKLASMSLLSLLFISINGYAGDIYSEYGLCQKEKKGGDRLWCYDSLYDKSDYKLKKNIIDCRENNLNSSSRRLYCYDGIMSNGYSETNNMGGWLWDLSYNNNSLNISYPMKNKPVPNFDDADIIKIYIVPYGESEAVYDNRLVIKCEDDVVQVYFEDKHSKSGYFPAPNKYSMMYASFPNDEQQYNNWYKYENKFIFNDMESKLEGRPSIIHQMLLNDKVVIHKASSNSVALGSNNKVESFTFNISGLNNAMMPFKQCFSQYKQ